ncbi:hypothetical protein OH492_15220 [Vibrio chagasii]|nr:hypothetical protein [Vibrio chagasii]
MNDMNARRLRRQLLQQSQVSEEVNKKCSTYRRKYDTEMVEMASSAEKYVYGFGRAM